MAQNVLVCCRFRPANGREKNENAQLVTKVDESHTSVNVFVENPSLLDELDPAQKAAANKQYPSFNFDYVFDWNCSQADVYEHSAKPMIKDIFAGYHTTLFAYGQTGSGKSHTMMGRPTDEEKGVIPRLVEAIFQGIEDAEEGMEFTVKLSYVEIYNERIRDLLNQTDSGDNLKIRELQAGVYIEGVTETYVSTHDQVVEIINAGSASRAQASTLMNAESSRSHSVLIMTLGSVDRKTGSKKGSRISLIDLAGSEKIQKTGAVGQTLDEAKHINKSLSALGNVINSLTSNSAHIPYRDSKLTRLLSDSLGGNSKTCLIITCSPMSTNVDETISTLRFGTRAKMIKNKPKVNQEKSISEYKRLLTAANARIAIQEQIIEALEKDVSTLSACLRSVDPQYLKIPIPELRSADRAKLAPKLDDEGNPIKETKPPSSAGSTSSTDSSFSSSSSSNSQIPETPSKSSTANSDSVSDPTSPGEASRYLESRSTNSPSSASNGTAEDLLSSMPARITILTLEKAELENQLTEMQRERDNLADSLQDKERELEEAGEIAAMEKDILSLEMKTMMTEMEAEKKRRDEINLKLRESDLKVAELGLLKKKVELMERDHSIAVAELTEDKRELSSKLMEALNEMNERFNEPEQAMPAPPRASMNNNQLSSSSITGTAGAAASMASASLGLNSPAVRAAVGVGSAIGGLDLMKPRKRGGSGSSSSSLLFGSELRGDDSVKIDTLTQALQRKCDQYIQLQMAHQNSAEHISMLEVLLAESNARLKEASEGPAKRARELEEKLAAAENLCAKLLESGRYWRNERKQKDGPASPRKVVVPTMQSGAQKKAPIPVKKDDMSMFF